MSKVFAFLADGLEEVECLAVVDVLRRAGVETTLISVTGKREITGSHGICFLADALFEEVNTDDADVLFLPGGMPGTNHLKAHEGLADAIRCAGGHLRGSQYPGRDGSVKGQDCHLLSRF